MTSSESSPFVVAALGAHGPNAPSFRVRTQLPSAELERHGVVVLPFPFFSDDEAERFAAGSAQERARIVLQARRRMRRTLPPPGTPPHAALIQRQVDLLPTLRLERQAAAGRRLILDVDDAVWLDGRPEAGGHPLAFLKGTARKLKWLARSASHVIAGNALLAEWLSDYSSCVTVIPSLVDPLAIPAREHAERPTVTLGWIGSPSTARQLQRLDRTLTRLAAAAPAYGFELLAVGGRPPVVQGMKTRYQPWSEEAELDALRTMDIGLMPLENNAWTRGKCAYKAIQYMAAGVPVVADDVGISAQVIGHESAGLVVGGSDQWIEALAELARDTSARARLGAEGRARAERGFSVQRWAPQIASILKGEVVDGVKPA